GRGHRRCGGLSQLQRGRLRHRADPPRQWRNGHVLSLLAARRGGWRRPPAGRVGPCSQGVGSVITETSSGWAKNAVPEFKSPYIGGSKPAEFRRVLRTRPRRISARLKEALRPRWLLSSSGCLEGGVLGSGPMEQARG